MFTPSYVELSQSGELQRRADALEEILQDCTLCPHECHINRTAGDSGECGATGEVVISSSFAHYGEEAPLVGFRGSGTIFLTHCNLKCVFCQNSSISHDGEGQTVDIIELAAQMIVLQQFGCHNINFVTPTHYVPQILRAVSFAAEQGLSVPLVYNSSGYDSVETLRLLDGIIDIYMPDTKFANNVTGKQYTLAENYADVMFAALREMHRQVGDLAVNKNGIAERGMIIRHLVMPNNIAGSDDIVRFIAEELSVDSYVNIMDQYRPMCRAFDYPELNRQITHSELNEVIDKARRLGLHRGF